MKNKPTADEIAYWANQHTDAYWLARARQAHPDSHATVAGFQVAAIQAYAMCQSQLTTAQRCALVQLTLQPD